MRGKLVDLSLGGCRIGVEPGIAAGILGRFEMQFQLDGISFRIVGVPVGTRGDKSVGVRFLDLPMRRRVELAEAIAELTGRSPFTAQPGGYTDAFLATVPVSPPLQSVPVERRAHRRHAVDVDGKVLLVKSAVLIPGRLQNLSLGGCRFRTEERFDLGIYVRVETEFSVFGRPFRIAGVSQAIVDKNTIGIRFLDLSDRRTEQLIEVIAELVEAEFTERAAAAERLTALPSITEQASQFFH
jgi:c-di-GMP-binding flagellar brake protein YcgR